MFLLVQVTVFLVYAGTLVFARPAVEDPAFYMFNVGVQSLSQLAQTYLHIVNWYRPSQFYVPYYLMTRIADWHSLHFFKGVNLFFYGTIGYLLLKLALEFGRNYFLSFFALAWWVTHTTNFFPVNNVTGFDSIYQVFSLGFVLAYWRHLVTGLRRFFWLAFLFFCVALTCKEVTVANIGTLVCLVVLHYVRNRPCHEFEWKRTIQGFLPFLSALVFYFYQVFPRVLAQVRPSSAASGSYRTQWNGAVVWEKVASFAIWIPKLDQPTYLTYYDFRMGQWYYWMGALPFLASLICIFYYRRKQDFSLLLFLLAWILIYAAVPVVCGGFPWHASLSNIGMALLIAVAFKPLLEDPQGSSIAKKVLMLFGGATLLAGAYHIYEFAKQTPRAEAAANSLYYPPVPRNKIRGNEFFLINDTPGWGYVYYGHGYLFRWVYLRPEIRESVLQESSKDVLKQWLDSPTRHCVELDQKTLRFSEVTEKCEKIVSDRLMVHTSKSLREQDT